MVKTFVKAIIALFIVTSAYAGTAGGDANGKLYNTAYFDVHPKTQAPMLDYITYSKRASFDVKQYIDTVRRIKEKYLEVYVHGRVVVPSDIKTEKVYISVGPNYSYSYGDNEKHIYYNGSKVAQDAEYFLVSTKTDKFGDRYVDYKISFHLYKPYDLTVGEKNVAPNTFFFSMAPKKRGFKNKFEKADIYVFDE